MTCAETGAGRMKSTGERIRELRESMGLSLEQVAKASGIDFSLLWRYENGELRNPSIPKLLKLCPVLGVSVAEFFRGMHEELPFPAMQPNPAPVMDTSAFNRRMKALPVESQLMLVNFLLFLEQQAVASGKMYQEGRESNDD